MNKLSPQSNSRCLIFLHIPKAAGSTMLYALRRQYKKKEIYSFNWRDYHQSIDEFAGFSQEKKNNFAFLHGHIPFGIHNVIGRNSTYITILRDPVERVISHYNYAKRTSSHYLHSIINSKKLSLKDYVSNNFSDELVNGQLRLIAGVDTHQLEMTDNHVEIAKENINKHFSFIGITEYFDESLLLLQKILCWRSYPFYISKNITPKNKQTHVIPERILSIIKEKNKLDQELYDYAKAILMKKISNKGDLFIEKLKSFKRANKNYNRFRIHIRIQDVIHQYFSNVKHQKIF